jgi:two-component system, chemotaxis family, sensor kinase CheA
LIRNSIDHGIESPAERERLGKPRRASLKLTVTQTAGNMVEIVVADDGAGINLDRVRESAVKSGLVAEEDAGRLTRDEIIALIFQSSLTTSAIITEISGRGLGMAIVKEKLVNLGGQVTIETEAGVGTTIRLVLPVTVATFRGILIRVGGHILVVPTTNMERVLRMRRSDVRTIEGRETIVLSDEVIAVMHLEGLLELPKLSITDEKSDFMMVIVLSNPSARIAFVVDDVLEEQEVLVKSLGKPLKRVRNVGGVTVLGSGRAAPILHVNDLLKSSRRMGAHLKTSVVKGLGKQEAKRVLVVDDTITARMLMKNILESAGYSVKTANDGIEAWSALKQEHFDLVLADIEMPNMNGWDLTNKIRQDKKLADMPVIVVTSLASREDRERGVSVGANAYFVKSSFDQTNLLEVIQKLV